MAKGVILNPRDFERVGDTVRHHEQHPQVRRGRVPERKRYPPTQDGGIKVGILDGALSAATNALDTPATATLSVYTYDSNGNLVDSTDNITVTNRYTEVATIASGTLMMVRKFGSEWWPITADCGATTIA